MTDHDVAEAMLEAGLSMIAEDGGLTVSMHHLSYESVINRAGVSRSAAYRVWSHKEQFHADLLVRVSRPQWLQTAAVVVASRECLADAVEAAAPLLADPATHELGCMEVFRLLMLEFNRSADDLPYWRTYINSRAALNSLPDNEEKEAIIAGLGSEFERFISDSVWLYSTLFDAIGLRVKPPITMRHVVVHVGDALEAVALRLATGRAAEMVTLDLPDGPQEWTLSSLALTSFLRSVVEPVPDFDPKRTRDFVADMRNQLADRVDS